MKVHETAYGLRIDLDGAVTALAGLAQPGAEAVLDSGSVQMVTRVRLGHSFTSFSKAQIDR